MTTDKQSRYWLIRKSTSNGSLGFSKMTQDTSENWGERFQSNSRLYATQKQEQYFS